MSESNSNKVHRITKMVTETAVSGLNPAVVHSRSENCAERDQLSSETTPAVPEHARRDAIRGLVQRQSEDGSAAAKLEYDPISKRFRLSNRPDSEQPTLKVTCLVMYVD